MSDTPRTDEIINTSTSAEMLVFRLSAKCAELERELADLRAQIGTAPEGSHPDEQKPRAETWHQERQNWADEVRRLREAMAGQAHGGGGMSDTIDISADQLFPVVETLSPRLAWMLKHGVCTWYSPACDEDPWCAWFRENATGEVGGGIPRDLEACGFGDTEEAAIEQLATKHQVPLWNEEAGA